MLDSYGTMIVSLAQTATQGRFGQEVTVTQETRQEVDARAALEDKRKVAQASIPGLEKDVAKAVEASASIPKGSPPADYIAASVVLGTAVALLEGAQADVKRCDKGLVALVADEAYERDMAAYEESTKACRNVTNPFVSAQQKTVLGAKDIFAKAGVNSVITRTTLIEGEVLTVVELVGPNKPAKPRKGGRKSGGGNGGGRFVNVSPDGSQRLSDREFVALVGPKHIGDDKTEHALTATGGTLYVTATSLRGKAGWTREQK